jgi:SIT family siderophore-iron:H+ symporter-like MFS transporter
MLAQTAPVLKHDGLAEDVPTREKSPSLDNNDVGTDKDTFTEDGRSDVLVERKSKGVVEMEALAEKINTKYLILLYGGFAILAYVLSLSESTRISDMKRTDT